MTDAEKRKLFEDSRAAYGTERELLICMEECGELVQALSKQIRYGSCLEHLAEEIGDVMLTCEKVSAMYGLDEKIRRSYEAKLERLQKMLETSKE